VGVDGGQGFDFRLPEAVGGAPFEARRVPLRCLIQYNPVGRDCFCYLNGRVSVSSGGQIDPLNKSGRNSSMCGVCACSTGPLFY
jgi:hypothetical protein